jgi:hypothetical protein
MQESPAIIGLKKSNLGSVRRKPLRKGKGGSSLSQKAPIRPRN